MVSNNLKHFIHRNAIYLLLVVYALAGLLTIRYFDGTGDNGDSIMHYLFARYAPAHPALYFDHWAKPLFVLLSSPFARFGFTGMKVFNLCVVILTCFVTYRAAGSLQIRNPLLGVVFLIFTPLYYILTYSGLTEPLFALFLILAVFLTTRHNLRTAAIVVSFMPFVRSEGLIIILVFGIYFLYQRQWKYLPWLITGHAVYSLAGYPFYHDLLWVFTRIPYVNVENNYGHGTLTHFVFQLVYVIGIPLYMMLCLGIISYPWRWFRQKTALFATETILILVCFSAFFIAHTLFWYFGIFHSMGLKRVLLGVVPLISLIALQGFNFITSDLFPGHKLAGKMIGYSLLAYLLVFPFLNNPASIHWDRDMNLTNSQRMAQGLSGYIREHPIDPGSRFFYASPYLSDVLKIDHFDRNLRLELTPEFPGSLRHGDIIIWDSWFAVVEASVSSESLLNHPGLVREIDFKGSENNHEVSFVILRKEYPK